MGEVILFASGRGGSGRSSCIALLGVQLSRMGKRVLLMDLSGPSGCLDLLLHQEHRVVYHIADVFQGVCMPSAALLRCTEDAELYLLPASGTVEMSEEQLEKSGIFAEGLREKFDYILIDIPSGDRKILSVLAPHCSRIVLTSACDPVSIRCAERLLFSRESTENFSLLLNDFRPALVKDELSASPEEITEKLGIPLLGILPEDRTVYRRSDHIDADNAGKAYEKACRNIAARIAGEPVPIRI